MKSKNIFDSTYCKVSHESYDKLHAFYSRNPNLSFEAINIAILQFLENAYPLYADDKENAHSLQNIHSVNFNDQFAVMKRELLNEFERVIHSPDVNVHSLLEKTHNSLIEKTSYLINTSLPKYNSQQSNTIIESVQEIHKSLKQDYARISTTMDNNNIKEFVQNFDLKLSMLMQNLQQPIHSSITNMEDRLCCKINTIYNEVGTIHNRIQDNVVKIITDKIAVIAQTVPNSPSGRNTPTSIKSVLTPLFPSAEINSDKTDSTIYTLKRTQKPTILLKSIDSEDNIDTDIITDYLTHAEDSNCNGILLSHISGISTKKNFEIEIHNQRIFVYLHNVDFNGHVIATAVDIIDSLSNKLSQYIGKKDETMTIPKDIMDSINNEYHTFITQKLAIIDMLKEQQKQLISQLDEFKFPMLDKYLSTHYIIPVSKPGLKCELCKVYSANNLKALAAHKRGCARKQKPLQNITNVMS